MLCLSLLAAANMYGDVIKGKIKDARTGEELIGASVFIKEEPSKGAVTGLDGSFSLSATRRKCTLVCSYIGYKKREIVVDGDAANVEIPMAKTEWNFRVSRWLHRIPAAARLAHANWSATR